MEEIDINKLNEIASSYLIQKDQVSRADKVLLQADKELDALDLLNNTSGDQLDNLLAMAEQMCGAMGLNEADVTEENLLDGLELTRLTDEERDQIVLPYFDVIETVATEESWESYLNSVRKYATENHIDLEKDPFSSLLTEAEKNEIGQRLRDDYLMQKAHCDKYDYAIAAFCGVISGLIDSFFVGMPGKSKLGSWTDKQADEFISNISKTIWKMDSKKRDKIKELFTSKKISSDTRNQMLKDAGIPYNQNLNSAPDSLQQCIQYLEKKFGVNYDASSAAYIEEDGVLGGMNPINHHILGLAHSPTPIGLIFSIIDQFTGKATFADNGKLIRVTPVKKKKSIDDFELRGGSFPTKLICGTVNWLGHLCSDLVGSNTTRADETKRGAGLPAPLMEILQLCSFDIPDKEGKTVSMSKLTVDMFEKGYDLRFSMACAIPVVINEFFIRLLWALKSRFYHHNSWKESIPFGNHPELRRMLLAGHGTLCLVDAADAAIRSIDLLSFSLHLNSVAWERLAIAGLQEARALYKENVVDIDSLENDLEMEWNRLLLTSSMPSI